MADEPRLLIVDDELIVIKSVERVLKSEGYQIEGAVGGREAILKMEQGNYDLVFTDLKMPEVLIAFVEGRLTVVDLKAAKQCSWSYLLQSVAYQWAAREMGLVTEPTVGLIVRLPKTLDDLTIDADSRAVG